MDINKASDILRILQRGWPSIMGEDKLSKWFHSLVEKYNVDLNDIGLNISAYPLPANVRSQNGIIEWFHPTDQVWAGSEWEFTGKRYALKVGGQEISVVMDDSKKIIHREYTDNGDYHVNQVRDFLTGWPKAIEQKFRGGRKKTNEWQEYERRWEASGFENTTRRKLREEYLQNHPHEKGAEERFDRYMRQFKQKRTK